MHVQFELSDSESIVLELMASELDMSISDVMRSALRLYQQQHIALQLGHRPVTLDKFGDILEDKVFGCPALD